jgi:hypothetical protein
MRLPTQWHVLRRSNTGIQSLSAHAGDRKSSQISLHCHAKERTLIRIDSRDNWAARPATPSLTFFCRVCRYVVLINQTSSIPSAHIEATCFARPAHQVSPVIGTAFPAAGTLLHKSLNPNDLKPYLIPVTEPACAPSPTGQSDFAMTQKARAAALVKADSERAEKRRENDSLLDVNAGKWRYNSQR